MCRSDFGKQEGEFELVVRSIEALAATGHEDDQVGGRGGEKGDLERQGSVRNGSRFPGMFRRFCSVDVSLMPCCVVDVAVSWKALGLAVLLCVGLTYAVRQWGARV